ncbi:M48 family metallopeptidase [Catellatospora bangladeshensis]|uniref:Peptidase M48 domain-containing protein n=1 Tax=Catellatospora bangladeshensis TaxID=310355 RepID=A0A8J3J670_9ACTN|nr:M48 family metallopeptidase [Catellatospora bangladeshensis]GIF78842.1 hypothetical protein Cba03nite_01910 [Catellatospora bangladeshensis]
MSIIQAPGAALCPSCHHRLSTEGDEVPWCERCEWNLGHHAPQLGDGRLTGLLRRWSHRIGYELDTDLYAELAARPLTRPATGVVSAALTVLSLLIVAVLLGLVAGGVWLLVEGWFLLKVVGAVMIGCAVLCRPRLGRLAKARDGYDEVGRDTHPELFALIDRVAAAVGAPTPHLVLLGPEWNASTCVAGLRRRRILILGLPLLTSLRPQERVALLAHELAHFVNNDNRRSLRTQLALTFFGNVADLLDPMAVADEEDESEIAAVARLGGLFVMLLWPLSRAAWLLHLFLHVLGARDAQRAEYHADDLAARAAGSTAAVSLLDTAACVHLHRTVVGSRARSGGLAAEWRAAVEQARAATEPRLGRLRQLTRRRDASPFSSHPPAGLRHRMACAQPYRTPAVGLSEAAVERLDAELAGFEERYRRVIAASW